MTGRLAGKVAIVTGAGAGLGAVAASRFSEEGAHVICADVVGERAEQTAAGIQAAGTAASALAVDVRDLGQLQRGVDQMVAEHGSIDVLYANAGVGGSGNAVDTNEQEWHRVIDINLTGVWRSCKAVLPSMMAAGRGSIVTQSSIGALRGAPAVAAYAASKAGVIGLTRQMAVDFGPHGIRVNAIAPGTVPTDLVREVWASGAGMVRAGAASSDTLEPPEGTDDFAYHVAKTGAQYPLGRMGTPLDIANLALFLASDEASWITGGVYVVDGGRTAG